MKILLKSVFVFESLLLVWSLEAFLLTHLLRRMIAHEKHARVCRTTRTMAAMARMVTVESEGALELEGDGREISVKFWRGCTVGCGFWADLVSNTTVYDRIEGGT